MFCCMDCDIKDIPEWCRGHVRMATTVCVMAIVGHVLDRGSSGCLVGGWVGGSGQEHTFNFSWRPHTPLSALAQHASYSRWTLSSCTETISTNVMSLEGTSTMTRRKVLEQWWQVVKALVHEGIVGGGVA